MVLQQKILEAAATELQKQLVECQKERDALQEKCNVFADKTIAMRQQLAEANDELATMRYWDQRRPKSECLEAIKERDELRQQLEECERERESFHMDYRMKCDAETKVLHEQLATVTRERDELVDALEQCKVAFNSNSTSAGWTIAHRALAKLGAEKTEEV